VKGSWSLGDPPACNSKTVHQVARRLKRSVDITFNKAGLDVENDEHWRRLALLFCAAIYGKSPGTPKKWKKKDLRQLLHDVNELKGRKPEKSDKEYCAELCGCDGYGRHKVQNPRTLRRVLQTAQAHAYQSNLLRRPVKEALSAG
jgi:hypothetical protein